MRNAQPLARGIEADAALEVEPVGAGSETLQLPVAFFVELAQQLEEFGMRDVEVGIQFGDTLAKLLTFGQLRAGIERNDGGHGSLPGPILFEYTVFYT